MAKTTVAELEARVAQLEEMVKALCASKTVLHRPEPSKPGTYPLRDKLGRAFRQDGNVRCFAPLGHQV